MPGFGAEASCYESSGAHYRPPANARTAYSTVQPAEMVIVDAFTLTNDVDGSPFDVCDDLLKCCRKGYVDCCIDYRRDCQT
jgi:hypothetical protein